MHRIWLFFSFYKFQTISDKILCKFSKLCLKFFLSPYTMLQTHNIACCNFFSLLLNIVKRGKRLETNDCWNTMFSHGFCHWLLEVYKKKCKVRFYACCFKNLECALMNLIMLRYTLSQHNDGKQCQNSTQNATIIFLSCFFLTLVRKRLLQAHNDK